MNNDELTCEFGCKEQVKFVSHEQVKVTDSEGQEILCTCGKI